MKIKKLGLVCDDYQLINPDKFRLLKIVAYDVKVPLNQEVIKAWVKGMDKIERESFYSILSEFILKKND